MHFRRTATADLEVAGQPIAVGDKVVMWYTSANRDEAQFTGADRFDIARTPNDHVSFGVVARTSASARAWPGSRPASCSRSSPARMPTLEQAGDPVRLKSNFINGIKSLPVRV